MLLQRAAKVACDEGFGVNATGLAVYLDFEAAIQRYGKSEAGNQAIIILMQLPSASWVKPK